MSRTQPGSTFRATDLPLSSAEFRQGSAESYRDSGPGPAHLELFRVVEHWLFAIQPPRQGGGDSGCGASITVWAFLSRHCAIRELTTQQPRSLADDDFGCGADYLRHAHLRSLRPLRYVPQYQHRFVKNWCFLLHAS